jgi:hypothetical protein
MPRARKISTPKALPRDRTCCGVIEEATYQAREKRERQTKGQSWVVLKLMIGFTLGIMGYSTYVYIGRFCLKMIQRREGAGGSRGTGSEYPFLQMARPCFLRCKFFLSRSESRLKEYTLLGVWDRRSPQHRTPFLSLACLLVAHLISHVLVALLVVFAILLLWMLWAYAKVRKFRLLRQVVYRIAYSQVTLTPPGFAKDVRYFCYIQSGFSCIVHSLTNCISMFQSHPDQCSQNRSALHHMQRRSITLKRWGANITATHPSRQTKLMS